MCIRFIPLHQIAEYIKVVFLLRKQGRPRQKRVNHLYSFVEFPVRPDRTQRKMLNKFKVTVFDIFRAIFYGHWQSSFHYSSKNVVDIIDYLYYPVFCPTGRDQ